jgi:hypothetical protein
MKMWNQMVRDDLKLPDDVGEITQISRKRLAVRILTMKSPFYPTENLQGGKNAFSALALACLKKSKSKVEPDSTPDVVVRVTCLIVSCSYDTHSDPPK